MRQRSALLVASLAAAAFALGAYGYLREQPVLPDGAAPPRVRVGPATSAPAPTPDAAAPERPPEVAPGEPLLAPAGKLEPAREAKRLAPPKPPVQAPNWPELAPDRRMSAILFLGLSQGADPYDLQAEGARSGMREVAGVPEVLDSFERLTRLLLRADASSAAIQREAREYLRSYNRLFELNERPENRENMVRVFHGFPSDFDDEVFVTTVRMGGFYAYCLAEGKCSEAAIAEAEERRTGAAEGGAPAYEAAAP